MENRTAPAAPLGHGETVLIVDDNDEIRTLAAHQLRRFGYTVIEAVDPAAALAILQSSQHVDLLFTDVVMPGSLSGPELAERAKALRPALKLLFTSGFPDSGSGERLPDALWLCKPYRRDELGRKLQEALGTAP